MSEEGAFGFEALEPVILKDVQFDDLEILRTHRNEWDTRRWLEDAGVVEQQAQVEWFFSGHATKVRIAVSGDQKVGLARVDVRHGVGIVGGDVFSAYRGKGFGQMIFSAACTEAMSLGARKFELWVFMDNERAVSIYKNSGFSYDQSAPVKHFIRDGKVLAYAKMVK